MSDLYDFVHGLVTHPIDTLTGKLDPPNAPKKPAYTNMPATTAPAGPAPTYKPSSYMNGKKFDDDTNKAIDAAS
jgi:hypothetical protein